MKKCKKIVFGSSFNQQICSIIENKPQYIPDCITHITFGWSFNQQIGGMIDKNEYISYLPKSLIFLKFGNDLAQNKNAYQKTLLHYDYMAT